MLLYSSHITPRLQYIVDFISSELLEDKVRLTDDPTTFVVYENPKINYSDIDFTEGGFYLKPVSLLFESGVRPQPVHCFEMNYHKAFFQTAGDFAFDIFAASFYLLSRYEEYLPHKKDEFGRYAHTNALAYREHFLDQPLVNIWLRAFRSALKMKFPELVFKNNLFRFIPTYDIDIAYSYLHKSSFRNWAGTLKSLIAGNFQGIRERIGVLYGGKKDPYDAYEWLDSLHLYCRVKPSYFFLIARDRKGHDRNISPRKVAFQELIRYHAAGYTVGIHPSWQSNSDEKILKEEIEWLETIAEKKITRSRQHYIKLELPVTYRHLGDAGIDAEFSMGYGSINGFRASVASPFYWYDLEKDRQSLLQVFPFCFMDANSFYEQGFSAQQAMAELLSYYHAIKRVNGLMITIWHNHFLGTDKKFSGWREVYEIFLKDEIYWDM